MCNFNNHYYYTGLVQVQQTTQMVGYCYGKYESWSGSRASGMHACRFKLNGHDCWFGSTVKDITNGWVQL